MQLRTLTRQLTLALGLALSVTGHADEPIWDANKVDMVSTTLAPGAFAFHAADAQGRNARGEPAATSGGLIVGSKAALLIDTMLNASLHAQVQALSADLSGKPVRYAINTSAHGDHSFGNMYLPEGTVLIQHERTQRFIAEHLDADKAFMLKYFGEGRGIEPITARAADLRVPTDGRLQLDLGGRVIEIIDFGFAQTGGDLWVWDAQSKVLWSGNPVIAGKPALPWLLDGHLIETLATLERVRDFLPEDARIVPGHGVPLVKGDLDWHIDYLRAVRDQVQTAVSEGLSLEQTVERVQLPEFGGYALFGWVHPGLNVPAAYRDLTAAAKAGEVGGD